jgi:hypothetical protein
MIDLILEAINTYTKPMHYVYICKEEDLRLKGVSEEVIKALCGVVHIKATKFKRRKP